MQNQNLRFIKNAGGCVVSKNVTNGKGKVKWLLRELPVNKADNGWRVFSDIDDNEFLSSPNNLEVCDFNTIANIEPAVIGIYLYPVGSDIQLVNQDGKIKFFDNITGKVISPIYK